MVRRTEVTITGGFDASRPPIVVHEKELLLSWAPTRAIPSF